MESGLCSTAEEAVSAIRAIEPRAVLIPTALDERGSGSRVAIPANGEC